MDKFVVVRKAERFFVGEKRSHLPVNISAKDKARKYPEGTFHVDNGSHKRNAEKNAGGKQQTLT